MDFVSFLAMGDVAYVLVFVVGDGADLMREADLLFLMGRVVVLVCDVDV